MMHKALTILLISLLLPSGVRAQENLLDSSAIETCFTYTDLTAAMEYPERVIKLSLRKKKLKAFPIEIMAFKNLQYLDLSKNDIKELPDTLTTLNNLQYLIVSKNRLRTLPPGIGKLKNLRLLNANQNDIGALPFSIGELENLEIADLWSNNLGYFPESMANLRRLKWMDLRNILIPQEHQNRIQSMIPAAHIEFSPPCKCSW